VRYLCFELVSVAIDGQSQRRERGDGSVEHVESELSMDCRTRSWRRDHQPMSSTNDQSTTVYTRLVQRLVHAEMVVKETTTVDLNRIRLFKNCIMTRAVDEPLFDGLSVEWRTHNSHRYS